MSEPSPDRTDQRQSADREKNRAALTSVLAAVFLTGFKLLIGLLTNSLGILAEAAHSALDLVAALITLFAVRISGRPADPEHHFGHGKVENFSALIEALLLLITCAWIITEALKRLFVHEVQVEANLWSFVVMGASIFVDVNRSRMLYRVARQHDSQALEADALHFSTDIWSSSVVIGGLILVRLADRLPSYRSWLLRADAVAALVVAAIVVWVSIRLGKRTVDALLDRAPRGLEEQVRTAILGVEHVQTCGRLRLRTSGPAVFVEATVNVAADLPAALAHEVASRVEEAVTALCPRCDVMVHVEPSERADDDLLHRVRTLAARSGLAIHEVLVHPLDDGYHLSLHVEVPGDLSLEQAHQRASDLEETLRRQIATVVEVDTHIETMPTVPVESGEDVTDRQRELVEQVRIAARGQDGLNECHDIRVWQVQQSTYVSLHCTCPADLSMEQAHRCSTALERRLQQALPQVAHFLVHVEPRETRQAGNALQA